MRRLLQECEFKEIICPNHIVNQSLQRVFKFTISLPTFILCRNTSHPEAMMTNYATLPSGLSPVFPGNDVSTRDRTFAPSSGNEKGFSKTGTFGSSFSA